MRPKKPPRKHTERTELTDHVLSSSHPPTAAVNDLLIRLRLATGFKKQQLSAVHTCRVGSLDNLRWLVDLVWGKDQLCSFSDLAVVPFLLTLTLCF